MPTNIYVGNLPYQVEEDELEELFSEYGQVESVQIIRDRETGRSKGFGFVQMSDFNEAQKAIDGLDGTSLKNRSLIVNKARPRKERGGGGGGGGGRGGGGGKRF